METIGTYALGLVLLFGIAAANTWVRARLKPKGRDAAA